MAHSRRRFILGVGAGVVGLGGLSAGVLFRKKLGAAYRGWSLQGTPDVAPRPGTPLPGASGNSRVVEVHHGRPFTSSGRPDERAMRAMLSRGLTTAFGVEEERAAWRTLFPDPGEVVGIKVNAVAGPGGPNTSPALVRALVHGLGLAGIPKRNVIVFDRSHEELVAAGFTLTPDGPGVRVMGTNNLFRWTQFAPQVHTVAGQPTRLMQVVRLCSAIINCTVPKHHGHAGFTGALKNWYGVIDRPQRFHTKINEASLIPEVAGLAPLRARVRLTVLEGLRSQSERGPHTAREWQFAPKLLLLGTDQVALDSLGARLIEAERRRRGLPALAETGREPSYIKVAASRGLGSSDLNTLDHLVTEV